MPNYCYYEMKIKGNKKDCERLYGILNYKDDEYVLARVFSAEKYDETDDTISLNGDCAWSIYSCMVGTGKGAYCTGKDDDRDSKGRLFTTLPHLSKILNLDIEIISDEPGIEFSEHYYISKGEIIEDECIAYPPIEVQYPDIGNRDIEEYLEETKTEYFSGIGSLVQFDYIGG